MNLTGVLVMISALSLPSQLPRHAKLFIARLAREQVEIPLQLLDRRYWECRLVCREAADNPLVWRWWLKDLNGQQRRCLVRESRALRRSAAQEASAILRSKNFSNPHLN
ncbi:MAG: hypothetical protein ABSF29_12795 [Tepidisphaeraceae bacterium]